MKLLHNREKGAYYSLQSFGENRTRTQTERNLEAGGDVEDMKECCLLACSQGLLSLLSHNI